LTILKTGCKVEIIDISIKNLCLDLELVKDKVSQNPKVYSGLVYVRSYGFEDKIEDVTNGFRKIKECNPDLLIVDDKCLSIPEINALPLVNSVDLELYSTGYSKFIDLGQGGLAKLNTNCTYTKSLTSFLEADKSKVDEAFKELIFNNGNKKSLAELNDLSNLSWLQDKNVELDNYIEEIDSELQKQKVRKQKINDIYDEILPDELKFSHAHNNWRYLIFTDNAKGLLKIFAQIDNLFISNHYYPLSLLFQTEKAFIWESLHPKVLNLFNDNRYNEDMAYETAIIIKNNYSI
jgi:hypothetical protein